MKGWREAAEEAAQNNIPNPLTHLHFPCVAQSILHFRSNLTCPSFQFACSLCMSGLAGLKIAHSCGCCRVSSCESYRTFILVKTFCNGVLSNRGARGHAATYARSASTVLVALKVAHCSQRLERTRSEKNHLHKAL